MENIPLYISASFVLATCLTIFIFSKATHNSKPTLAITLSWLTVQSVLSLLGFYTVTDTLPPRFILLIAPPLLLIAVLFFSAAGKKFIDSLNIGWLTLLHTVRVAVELVLFWLFLYKAVPQIMTFEGSNYDILSGLTAPFVFYFGFRKKVLSNKVLLLWNIVCLALLINIVVIAMLAAPFAFQQFAFNQPNIAVLYFPFTWLPCCVVPLVLFSHIAAMRQLVLNMKKQQART